MSPDERSLATLDVIVEKVRRLEEGEQEARQALHAFSARVDSQFDVVRALIRDSVATIKYVDEKSYERDRLAFVDALRDLRVDNEKGVKEAKADAERGIKIAWGIAVAFAVPFIGGLATIIIRAAS